jgi:hypothetical protein
MVSKVNVVTNRVGASRTITDFNLARTRPATKLEMNSVAPQARKVFLHVENIQPRIKPAGSWGHIAPDPGFSPSQIHRLALVYVAASVRAGRWLIPALHFNVDSGATALEPHDDPQKFDLAAWTAAVESIAGEIGQP